MIHQGREQLAAGTSIAATVVSSSGKTRQMNFQHALSRRQIKIMLQGGVINWVKARSLGTGERRSA